MKNTDSLFYDVATLERMFGRQPDSEAEVRLGAKLSLLVVLSDGPAAGGVEGLFRSMRRAGMSEEMIAELGAFDPRGAALVDFIPRRVTAGGSHARRLVYALLLGALGDGLLGEGERRAIERVAVHLSVPSATVTSLRALVEMERAVDDLRLALFAEVPG